MSVSRRCWRACAALGSLMLGFVVVTTGEGAEAAVVHHEGFDATVLGAPSWYGSYALAEVGPVWCIDKGLAAPDADLAYARTEVDDLSADTRTAVAVAGARLTLAYDADADGSYETAHKPIVTTAGPVVRDGLLPGEYRLVEAQAPDGYQLNPNPVVLTTEPGATATVALSDDPHPVEVTATKVDAVTGATLAGAVYDLYRKLDDDTGTPPPAGADPPVPDLPANPPADAPDVAGHDWVGRATADTQGRLSWPGVIPGTVHCARELPVPPSGSPAPPPPPTPPTMVPPASPPLPPADGLSPPKLARTGAPLPGMVALGGGLALLGVAFLGATRRRTGLVDSGGSLGSPSPPSVGRGWRFPRRSQA